MGDKRQAIWAGVCFWLLILGTIGRCVTSFLYSVGPVVLKEDKEMKRRLIGFGNLAALFLLLVSLVGCGGAQSTSFAPYSSGPSGGSGNGGTESYRNNTPGVTTGKDAPGLEFNDASGKAIPPGSSGSVAAMPTSTTGSAPAEQPLINVGGAGASTEPPSSTGSGG